MKSSSLVPGRFALSGVAAAALCLLMPSAWALGLGRLVVQSSLGEGLKAEIDISSLTPEEASNLKVRIAAPESYRTAGVDYNAVLPSTQVSLQRHTDGRPYLRLTSDRAVQEPFVDVILELTWNTGRLVREYTLLFDPPVVRAQAPAPATPPVMAAAPRAPAVAAEAQAAPPAAVRTPEARPAPTRPAPPAAPAPASGPAPAPAPALAAAPAEPRKPPAAAAPAASDSYRVKQGDTLSGIAGRTQPQGVSLDQMLVALYRANPQAFVENNMNRLRSGVVLAVPDAEAAKAAPAPEARQFIQAQSADFAAYRQRLAGSVAPVAAEASARQASGKVEAAVDDRKQASTPTPDKLTLSKAGAGAKASAPEAQLSKEREAKDAATRAAELKKNVDDLQKLTAGAKPAAAAASVATAPATAVAVAASAAGPAVVAGAVAPVAAASVAVAASASAAAVANAAAETASAAVAPAPKIAAAASRPAAPPAAPVAEGPGVMDTLLEDPMALAGGGLIVALLAGFGVYRYVKRSRRDSGETSFLESRLQPDSFFGVSGGQHIDTRETAAGPASSMGYSLSQLDAIGDVDPVAEADVYLAYGRDLQAEEILKEAMRSSPERMAIRTKLLEVYAKRRDTKGFELLATQLFALTRGTGEDWAKAQELGAEIDPENPLFRPGGTPIVVTGHGGEIIEPLGASTMPQSVLPSPSQYGASVSGLPTMDGGGDLDLDLGEPVATTAPSPLEATQSFAPPTARRPEDDSMSLDFPTSKSTPLRSEPPSAKLPEPEPFDLSGISLDLDLPPGDDEKTVPRLAKSNANPKFDDSDLPSLDDDGNDDPLARKIELAEEFRQIGDKDGARDLLNEVVAKASGAVKSKAQSMLADLG